MELIIVLNYSVLNRGGSLNIISRRFGRGGFNSCYRGLITFNAHVNIVVNLERSIILAN